MNSNKSKLIYVTLLLKFTESFFSQNFIFVICIGDLLDKHEILIFFTHKKNIKALLYFIRNTGEIIPHPLLMRESDCTYMVYYVK